MRVRVVFVFLPKIGMCFYALGDVHELYPLFLGRRAPSLEPTLIEVAYDFLKGVFLHLTFAIAAWIGILWIEFS